MHRSVTGYPCSVQGRVSGPIYCRPPPSLLLLILLILLHGTARPATDPALAASFDAGFLQRFSGQDIDISRFSQPAALLPGHYHLDLLVNDQLLGQTDVTVSSAAQDSAICISKSLPGQLPVKPQRIDMQALKRLKDGDNCLTLTQLIPQATARVDISRLQLRVTLPQALLQQSARDAINPLQWDDGVSALLLGYNSNYYSAQQGGTTYRSFYSGNELGMNLHGFHFRHRSTLNWQPERGSHYQSLVNALQHDITPLQARLTVGDADTSGYLFDSFAWRGAALASDDAMLPDSRRGYAPVIQGVAQSNARVSIRQGSTLLYETSVPPGPFRIDDLYPTGYGGDLQVTVREEDGRESQFSVPYASLPQLVRAGSSLFSITAGQLRGLNQPSRHNVLQATLQHGISNRLTGYTGLLASQGYHAVLLGSAVGTRAGALAVDITQTGTRGWQHYLQGRRYRLSYSKIFSDSNTTLSATLSQLSSPGYQELRNAVQWLEQPQQPAGDSPGVIPLPRNRLSLSLAQRLPQQWGQLNLALLSQHHWGGTGRDTELQASYSNNFRSAVWSLSASRVQTRSGNEMLLALNVALPLGGWRGGNPLALNMNLSHSSQGVASQAGISSSLGSTQELDYSLSARRDEQQQSSGSLSATWHRPATTLAGSVALGSHSRSWSGGLSGAVAMTAEGVTFSPWYSETMALITAPGAAGAEVAGYPGMALNSAGRALLPWLMPYRQNEIALNPQKLSQDVALLATSQKIVPRSGSLVRLEFATRQGQPVLIHSTLPHGGSLPFGASVRDEQGNLLGRVTQGNTIYVRLPPDISSMLVSGTDQPLCRIRLPLAALTPSAGRQRDIRRLSAPCLPVNISQPARSTAL